MSIIEEQQQKYPNAYKPWTSKDDKKLEEMVEKSIPIVEISRKFKRNPGAIRSRLNKLKVKQMKNFKFKVGGQVKIVKPGQNSSPLSIKVNDAFPNSAYGVDHFENQIFSISGVEKDMGSSSSTDGVRNCYLLEHAGKQVGYIRENGLELVTSLPVEYIVKCSNVLENQNVYSNYYNDSWIVSRFWKYITCSPKIENAQFRDIGKLSSGEVIHDSLKHVDQQLQFLPILTYQQWNKLKNKKEEKMEKKIKGYVLKEEFKNNQAIIEVICKAEGYKLIGHTSVKYPLVFPSSHTHSKQSIQRLKDRKMLDAFFDVVYEDFLEGDWVIATTSMSDTLYIGRYIDNTRLKDWSVLETKNPSHPLDGKWMSEGSFVEVVRKATNEEIEDTKLLHARFLYPEGTRVVCLKDGKPYTINEVEDHYTRSSIWGKSSTGMPILLYNYDTDKWADVIKAEIKKFGEVEFECNEHGAQTKYGFVKLEEIEKAIEYIQNPPYLAGHALTIHSQGDYNKLEHIKSYNNIDLGFGYQPGTFKELVEIRDTIKSLKK